MKDNDQLSGLFWLAVSVFICIKSIDLKIGGFHSPGPGFLPFWSAFILGTLAIILVVKRIVSKRKGAEITTSSWKGRKLSKVIWISLSFIAYVLVLPKLGYLLSTFGLLTFLFGIIEKTRIWVSVLTAIVTVVGSYLIFYVWLQVQLPKGIFLF
jgi:putative tricarboxylic transport membrane protein